MASRGAVAKNGHVTTDAYKVIRQVYDAKEAQKAYETNRSDSRIGIDLTPEELQRLDDIITPLIRQGQSIHQICVNNADDIMCDERSIYNYVDAGILSVDNIDLPRKVRYRKRRKKKVVHIDKLCHVGRTYEDFQKFMEKYPDLNVVEMDSVEGARDSLKVLLTLFFRDCSLMLAFLREANTARSVTDIFNALYDKMGRETFMKLFPDHFSQPIESFYDCFRLIYSLFQTPIRYPKKKRMPPL